MKEDLRYSVSDCFETFPFPCREPRASLPTLERNWETTVESRASYMVDAGEGLTEVYNLLKDPGCQNQRIEGLRKLHQELDHAVLDAYGVTGVDVPPYVTPRTEAERRAFEVFEDEVIDRLSMLNAQRAEEERREALSLAQREDRGSKGKQGKKKEKAQEDQMRLSRRRYER